MLRKNQYPGASALGTLTILGLVSTLLAGCPLGDNAPSTDEPDDPIKPPVEENEAPFDVTAAIAASSPAFLAFPKGEDLEDCQDNLALIEQEGIEHGYLDVPLIHQAPDSPTVRVHYYGKWTGRTGTAPLVFFWGFSGGAWWDGHIDWFYDIGDKLDATNTPWVVMDQRGSGCSVQYPATIAANASENSLYYGFTTAQIVRDAEAIRALLFGDQKWVIAGQSYGSLVVHQYLESFPQAIKAAHAHGYALLADRTTYRQAYQKWAMDMWDHFWAQNPQLDSKRDAVFALYEAAVMAECPQDPNHCELGMYPDNLAIPQTLWQATNTLSMETWADNVIALNTPPTRAWKSYPDPATPLDPWGAAATIVSRIDYLPATIDPEDAYGCDVGLNYHQDNVTPLSRLAGMKISSYALTCYLITPEEVALTQQSGTLSTGPTLEGTKAALVANPGIPFTLYSGFWDFTAPTSYFKDEAASYESLPNFEYIRMDGSHGSFYNDPFVDNVLGSL